MKQCIISLFICSGAIAMERPVDALALIVSKYDPTSSLSHKKTTIHNSTNKIINNSSIKNKTVQIHNHPDYPQPKNSNLIVIIKDPINRNIDAPISYPQVRVRKYSTDKEIITPEQIIIYKLLEEEAFGHMAAQTQLHHVLADKKLTPFAIAQFTKTALREYNNLFTPEALEYHTEKITNLVIAISDAIAISKSKL